MYYTSGYFYEQVHKVRFVTFIITRSKIMIKLELIFGKTTNSSILISTTDCKQVMKEFEKYGLFSRTFHA